MKFGAEYKPILIDHEDLKPALYNPRKVDPYRLELVKLSIEYLGFILPVYAFKDKEIASGHQRHHGSGLLKYDKIPVVFIEKLADQKNKLINVAFNRGTNDFQNMQTFSELSNKLFSNDFNKRFENLKPKTGDERFRCLNPTLIPTNLLIEKNKDRFNDYTKKTSGAITKYMMNLVITKDNTIVNGIGRLMNYIDQGMKEIPCVIISDEEKEFAESVLNFLTMDFDISGKYEDLLRFNSFRAHNGREENYLSKAFCMAIHQGSGRFDLFKNNNYLKWISIFGDYVLDVGAGTLADSKILAEIGVHCLPFEPFMIDEKKEVLDLQMSRKIVKNFLTEVAKGKIFDSIFMNAILNSVPFKKDRLLVVKFVSLFATDSVVYSQSASDQLYRGRISTAMDGKEGGRFELDYEERILITGGNKLKVQKFHTVEEWRELWETAFDNVVAWQEGIYVMCICREPKQLTKQEIDEVLEFELNLPHPENQTLGMVEYGKKCVYERFKKLGIKVT